MRTVEFGEEAQELTLFILRKSGELRSDKIFMKRDGFIKELASSGSQVKAVGAAFTHTAD